VKQGVYDVRIYADPFFEQVESKFEIIPGKNHEINITGIGVLQMNYPTTVGLYVYSSDDKLVGNYLTNAPFLLKTGNYRIFVNENCDIKNVRVENTHAIKVLTCKTKE
jgi:hypothetical protein